MKAPLLIGSAGLSFCPNSADVIMNCKTNVNRYFVFLICNFFFGFRLMGNFSVCVMAEMGKEYNITCDESERAVFIHNHSLSMQTTLSLAFEPADCLVISTTPLGSTSTPAPSRCQDSELVYDHLMLCAGPFFLSWKSERNETSFCRQVHMCNLDLSLF